MKDVLQKLLPPHVLRMQEEQSQLSDRIVKGRQFTASDNFRTLSTFQKDALLSQLKAMEQYSSILLNRIDYEILQAPEIKDQYPDGHPDWTKSEWQTDVALDNTVLGYWDWVEHNLTVAASEAVDGN